MAVETLSELLNNAADLEPGIRATLAQNPNLPVTQSDREAITLAIQELTSVIATMGPSLTDPADRTCPDARTGHRGKANSTRSQPRNLRPTRCAAVSVE